MSQQVQRTIRRVFTGDYTQKDISDWIDRVLKAAANEPIEGIAMSYSVFEKTGSPDKYGDIKVATDFRLWPEEIVEVRFK